MNTPSEEPPKVENVRMGMVQVSDGKSRPKPARLVLSMDKVIIQEEVTVSAPARDRSVPQTRERMVQLRRLKVGGLGLSIKGGAEHKLPILISKIYKDQAADQTGQLFVGDAVIKVNGEYITACSHDDAVGILRGAGDIVVLTVRHYRAAAPFLAQQEGISDNESLAGDEHPSAHNGVKSPAVDDNSNTEPNPEHVNGGWHGRESRPGSAASVRRPSSVSSDVTTTQWKEIAAVPLMMAYVTRFIPGTDKLRPGAFEVRGARCESTGVIHIDQPAALSHWIKAISDNIVGLTSLQMKLLNRQLSSSERIEHMCWVAEGEGRTGGGGAYFYVPRFLVLQGTDLLLYPNPPMNLTELGKSPERLKVYQCVVRVVKESETLDWRQHCFLLQWETRPTRYFSAETKRELLRIEAAWTATLLNAVLRLGKKTFTVVSGGKAGSLTLDWSTGFTLTDGIPGSQPIWTYRFSQLRGSSDDSKSKLKLHFQDPETKLIETKELECQILQSLLFCMHAFLTAKVASVDPAFLASIQQTHP